MDRVPTVDAMEEAARAGIDLALLDANLDLPVKERWAQHAAALDFAEKIEAAMLANDARLHQASLPAR